MADEVKLCSPIRSTFEALGDAMRGWALSWRRIGFFLLTITGYRCCNSWYISDVLSILLRCNSFARIQKAVVAQTGSRPLKVAMAFFLVQLWLWEMLWSCFLIQPLSSSHQLSYEMHFSLHVTTQWRNASLLCRIMEDTSKWWFLQFSVSSCGTHLLSFFTFPIQFKCPMTVQWSVSSSWATSYAVVSGSTSMIVLSRSLLPFCA